MFCSLLLGAIENQTANESMITIIKALMIPRRIEIHLLSLNSFAIFSSSIATVLVALGNFCECIGGRAPEGILWVLPCMARLEAVIALVLPVCEGVLPVPTGVLSV